LTCVKALHLDGAEVAVFEQTGQQPACRRPDDHRARSRSRLQARREVRGLADHRLFLRGARANEVADHHQTRPNPYAHL
jgi:hypothetical protein